MEFTKLSEVAVAETANDTDKVLIEQNGEIKRVPKTEVGGGGNTLIIDLEVDASSGALTNSNSNMTMEDTITAITNRELTGAVVYVNVSGIMTQMVHAMVADGTPQMGAPCIVLLFTMNGDETPILWNADGFTIEL